MKLVKVKMPWRTFFLRLAVVLAIAGAAVAYFNTRFILGYDNQLESSILGDRMYIIDTSDQHLEAGDRYAFGSLGLEPIFPDGTTMVKILVAMPGDHVEIGESEQILINGVATQFYGLSQAKNIGKAPEDFMGEKQLQEDELWFMGNNPISFDSRYYGAVAPSRVIGRAYPLW